MSGKGEDGRDKAWKYTKKTDGEKYFRCVLDGEKTDGELVLDEDMGLDEPLHPPSSDKSNKRKSDEGSSRGRNKQKMKKIAALLRDEDEIEDLTVPPHTNASNINDDLNVPPHTNAFNINDCDDIPVGVIGFEYDDMDD